MKFKLKNKNLITSLKNISFKLIYLILFACLVYFGIFMYNNFYLIIIKASNVSYEYIKQQQTVNQKLWDKIKDKSEEKKQTKIDTDSINDPFE